MSIYLDGNCNTQHDFFFLRGTHLIVLVIMIQLLYLAKLAKLVTKNRRRLPKSEPGTIAPSDVNY